MVVFFVIYNSRNKTFNGAWLVHEIAKIIDISTLKLPTGGIFKQECEVSAKLTLTPVTLVYQGLQVFLLFK